LASSFRGLHESLINYGGNASPEFLTCSHEEISVAMGHGCCKVEARPLAVMPAAPVGLQHAIMALYNAWCDRVPVYVVFGNIRDVRCAIPASSGTTPRRTSASWCALTEVGRLIRPRSRTSRSPRCAPTSSP